MVGTESNHDLRPTSMPHMHVRRRVFPRRVVDVHSEATGSQDNRHSQDNPTIRLAQRIVSVRDG